MKIKKDHFEGGKNLNDGHKHSAGPSLSELINELHDQKSFSLEELDTGGVHKPTGKPIFRKLFIVAAQGASNQQFIPIGATVDRLIKTDGFLNQGTNKLKLPTVHPTDINGFIGVALINSGTVIQIHTGSSVNAVHDGGEVWIEYTKV